VAASEVPSPPSPYPLFENTENAGGVIGLLPGHTSGCFVSVPIQADGKTGWDLLLWEENEPSLPQPSSPSGGAPEPSSPENLPENSCLPDNGSAGGLPGNPCPENSSPEPESLQGYENLAPGTPENSPEVEGNSSLENLSEFSDNGSPENLQGSCSGGSENLAPETSPPENLSPNPPENSPEPGASEGLENGGSGGSENLSPESSPEVAGESSSPQAPSENLTAGNPSPEAPGSGELAQENGGQENEAPGPETAEACSESGTTPQAAVGSEVSLQVRVSQDGENWGEWMGPGGPGTFFTSPPADLSFLPPSRYLQFRVLLRAGDPRLSGENGPRAWGFRISCGERDLSEESEGWLENFLSRYPRGKYLRVERLGAEGGEVQSSFPLLRRIRLKPARPVRGVVVAASPLESLPEGVPGLEGKRVLAYLEISTSLPRKLLRSAELEFSVPKGWLGGNTWRGSRVAVYHFDGHWEELPTRELGENSSEVTLLATTPGFSVFAFVDNTNLDFSRGLFENTENVDNYVRLISGYTLGRFTSRVFDAGGIAQWDNLAWSFVEPQAPASEIDYVGAEPDVLKDGSGRVGTLWSGSYANLQNQDGVVENVSEASTGGGGQQITYSYASTEIVYEGGTTDFDNAKAEDYNYENVYENLPFLAHFFENSEEVSNATVDPVAVIDNTFTPSAGDYLVVATAEIGSNNTAGRTVVDLIINDVYGEITAAPQNTANRFNIAWIKKLNFPGDPVNVRMTFNDSSGSYTAYIRNARIMFLKLNDYFYQERESTFSTTSAALQTVTTLNFSTATPDNYLILASTEASVSVNNQTGSLRLSIDDSDNEDLAFRVTVAYDWRAFGVMKFAELGAGSHSVQWMAAVAGGKYIYARRSRIIAIPIGKIVNYRAENTSSGNLIYQPSLDYSDYYVTLAYAQQYNNAAVAYENYLINNVAYDTHAEYTRVAGFVSVLLQKTLYLSAGPNTFQLQAINATASRNARIIAIYPRAALFDIEHQIMAATSKDNYELQVRYYVTGESGDAENVSVYLWNFYTGQWDLVGILSGGSATSPNVFTYDITGTNYMLGSGLVRVRFVQPEPDLKRTYLMLDYVRVREIKYLPAGQSLNWQYTITGVTTGYENYDLKITAYSYNDLEYIWVDVWNVMSGSWEFTGYYLSRNTPATITYRLSPIENYLDGENVYVRFRDDSPSDATPTYIIVDMVRLEEAFWGTSDVRLQVRVSGDNTNWTDWMGPDGTPNTYFEASVTSMENIPDNRYIQYRIYFWTNTTNLTGANGPKVDWVKISASSLPNLIYPIGGINLNNSRPTFQWETVAADNYRIQVATDSGFTNPVIDNSSIPGTENSWTPPSPLPDNLYYWRIQRYFNNSWYAWTPAETFRIDTIAPGPPPLTSPSDGEVLNDNTPLLDWEPPPENSYPLLYQVWIAYDSSFLSSVPGYPTGWISTDNYEVPSPGLPDNTYYWKVRAMDNAGNIGSWPTTYRSFRIDTTPPQVPTPIWPSPGQWTQARPNLDWSAVTLENDGDAELSTPILYEVQVSQDPTFGAGVYSSGWISDDNWIAAPCYENNTVWYWRVRARDNAGTGNESDWSGSRSFRVDNECPRVQLYLPENDAVLTDQLTVTLRWYTTVDGGSGLENYQIQIDDSGDFGSPLVDTLLPPTENSYTHPFPGIGVYWWRVRARDAVGNWGEWSESRCLTLRRWFSLEGWSSSTFTPVGVWYPLEGWTGGALTPVAWSPSESWSAAISAPVPAPVPLSPPNGTNINNSTPTFRWENLQPADTYDLQVDNDNDWTTVWPTDLTGLGAKSYTPFSPYPDGVYYWRVRQTRTGATGPWSEIWILRVDTRAPAAPILVSPRDGENLNDNTPLLDWEPVTTQADGTPEYATPVTYEIQLSNVSDFGNIVWSDNRFTSDNREVSIQLPDNVYYWRVRAWDNAGNPSAWSTVGSFRIDTVAPPAPILDYPTGGVWTNGAPNLQWHLTVTENSKPIKYRIQIRLSAGSYYSPVRDVWVEGDEVENWVVTPAITTEEVYYWHVMAIDNAGNPSPWSAEDSFRVDRTPPNKVVLYRPDNNGCSESLAQTFQWYTGSDSSPGSGIVGYWIQISTEPDFSTLVHENTWTANENSYSYTLPAYGRYYWRVCARDAVGWVGPWSDPFALHVGRWLSLETWTSSTRNVPLGWLELEGWAATAASVPPSWRELEVWSSGVSATAIWRSLDSWTSMVSSVPVVWRSLDSWSGTVSPIPLYWYSLDSWTSTVSSVPVVWRSLDSWSGTVASVPVLWHAVEGWTCTVSSVPLYWHPLESWGVTVPAPASWRAVEGWSGRVGTPVSWYFLEACTGALSAPVPAPILLSPRNGENMRETTPTLMWDNLQPADSYWFQVATDGGFNSIVVEFTSWVGKSYTHVAGFTDGLYYWRVCQTRTGVTGPWSQVWTFRVDTLPPRAPSVTFPTDNLNLGYPNPRVTWIPPEENSLPLTYDLWVDNDSDFGSPEVTALRLSENSYTLPSLPDGMYYLRVRAVDNAGNPGENAQLRFRIDTVPPAAPVLVSPADGVWVNENVTLDWEPVQENSTPVMYRVQVSIYSDFATIERDSGWIYGDNWTVTPPLVTEYRYYWRVKARDNALGPNGENGNEGQWSAVRSFRLDVKPPSVPSPSSPSPEACTENLTVRFEWARAYDDYDNPNDPWSSGVAYYVIQVAGDRSFSSPLLETTIPDNSCLLTLPAYGRYYWRVRAVDAVGHAGDWSENRPFHVGRWLSLETWTSSTQNVPLGWLELEGWSGTASTVVSWGRLEEWSMTLAFPASWGRLEEWSMTLAFPASWGTLEGWTVGVPAPASWLSLEGWSGTASTVVSWGTLEGWSGTVGAPVPPPVLISPPDRSGYAGVTVTFTWDNLQPADSYHIQIDDEDTFSPPLVADNILSTKSLTYDLPGTGTYYWKVRMSRTGAWSEWSAVWRVSVDVTPPAPPVLVSPRNWENLNDPTPLLDWEPVEENSYPVAYFVFVYDVSTNTQVENATLYDYGTGENTRWEVRTVLPDGQYYWKVYARDSAGWSSPSSEEWYFRVDTLPPASPPLDSPSDDYKTNQTTVTLSWFAPPENSLPLTYYAAVSDNPAFPYENENSGWIENPGWTVTLADGHWYWRVRARDNAGNVGPWSEVRRLVVDIDPPAAPILYLPENNLETNDNTVYFEWYPVEKEVTGAEEDSPPLTYYVSISDSAEFPHENYGSGWIPENRWESPPIPDGVWYWRVRARDNAGNVGPWSEVRRMVVDTSVPTPPVPLSPPDMDNLNNTTPTLRWENSLDLTTVWYKVWVATDNEFRNVVAESGWILENSWTTPALPDNLYYWRVQARDQFLNYSENSATFRFRVDTLPPSPPTPVWPVQVKVNDNSPNFRWIAPPENSLPLTYRVAVKNILGDVIHLGPWVYGENYEYPGELPDDEYYWCVQARDDAGNAGSFSGDSWFRVDTRKPSVPQPLSPVEGENLNDNTPLLRWTAVTTDITGGVEKSPPVTYRVWVATDEAFTNPLESPWLSENSWEVPALPDGVYYWRVCARDNAGNIGDNSPTRRFRVDTLPPENVFLIWPENGSNVGSQPNLDWNPAVDNSLPVRYRVLINRLGVTENYRDSGWILPDNWVVAPPLPDNDYEWRVLARDNAGNVFETPARWFRVETQPPAAPRLYSPLNGENTRDNTPLLGWENVWDVSRPVMFYVWVATDNNFTNVVGERGWIYENWWEITPALPDGVYYWRVCARDNVGNVGENSATWSFRVDTLPPAAVQLSRPENAWATENLTVTFEWERVEENSLPVVYTLQVGRDPSFQNAENLQTTENLLVHTLPGADHYYWRVRARDNAGNEGPWSEVRFLMICRWRSLDSWQAGLAAPAGWRYAEGWQAGVTASPLGWAPLERWTGTVGSVGPAPLLLSPANGVKTNENRPTFRWDNTNLWENGAYVGWRADSWEIWIDNTPNFDNSGGRLLRENTVENFYTPSLQLPDENYFWRVRGWYLGFPSPFSSTFSLLIDTLPPTVPQKVGPSDGFITTNLTVTLNWSPSSDSSRSPTGENAGVAHYELIVDNDFIPPYAHYDNSLTSTTKNVTLSPGIYRWIVRAWDWAGNVSENQAPWTFIIDTAGPSTPSPLEPVGTKTNATLIYFDWTDAEDDYSGVDHYHIQVDNDPDFGSPEYEEWPSASYLYLQISSDENYFWRVRAIDRAGNPGEWSTPASFLRDTCPPSAPSLSSPPDGHITENTTLTFTWSLSTDNSYSPTGESAGVWKYEVWVDNDSNFSSPEVRENVNHPENSLQALLQDGNYFWKVRAWDWAGNAGPWSQTWSFIVDTTPPEAPVLLSPPSGSSTKDNTPVLSWTKPYDLAGVWKYEVWVDNDPDFSSPEVRENVLENVWEVSVELPDENYFWRVRAYDVLGHVGSWSSPFSLMVDTVPPPAPSASPSDGTITKQKNPTLTWAGVVDLSRSPTGEVSGLRWYELQIDNDPDFGSLLLTQFTPDNVFAAGSDENYPSLGFTDENWFYRVRAWDNAGNAGPWSQTWSFIVDTTPPPPPVPLLPENNGMRREAQVTFIWSVPEDLSGIASYTLFVDNDEDFSSPSSYLVTTSSKTVTLTDERYYWRVRATDRAGNTGENSVTYSFLLDTVAPQVTTLGTPVNGLVTRENVQTFSWSYVQDLSNSPTGEVAGVRCYELWIDNDSTFTSPFLQENLTENLRQVELPDENWFWRVRVWDNAGNFSTSEVRSLLVDTRPPDVPIPSSPSDGAKTRDNRPVFSWSAVVDRSWSPTGENSGVRCYELWVDNDPDFSSPEVLENVSTTSFQPSFLPDENYSWRVRAWDWAGNAGGFSPTRTLLIDTVAPPAPPKVDVSPDTGVDDPPQRVVTKENTVTLYWQEVQDTSSSPTGENAGVRWYEVTLENVATGYRISENVAGTSRTLTVPEGEWRWWVRAWDWAGNVSENQAPWTLIVDLTKPSPPALVSPINGAVTNNYTIRFDWQDGWDQYGIPSTGAYTIQVDNSTAFSETSPYFKSATVDLSERTFIFYAGGAPQDERYYWRVKVKDNAGNESDWSSVWDVLLDTLPPEVPSKAYPDNNAVLNDNQVTLAWGDVVDRSRSPSGDVAGLACYELWVATDNAFSRLVLRENLTSSSRSLELPDNRYWWKVRAWDRANNASDFEAPFTFVVDVNPPPAPSLLSPENGLVTKDNRPVFRWTQVYDVTGVSYELWVDNDPDFSSPEVLENVEENSYQPPGLGDELYYWRVRAWDGLIGGNRKAGEFSEVRVFLVDTVPPDLPENSPLHGRIVGDKFIPLSWNPVEDRSGSPTGEVAGLSRYEVQVDNDPDFSSVDYTGTTADNVWSTGDPGYPSAGFREDNFYFRVRAWDNAGNVPPWTSCTVWNFVVDLTRPYGPALYLPDNNAAENHVAGDYVVVDHSWEEVKDASGIDHYEIQVSLNPSFTSLLPSEYFSSNPSHLTSPTVTVFYPYDGRYWWRVRAYDRAAPDQPGDWSRVYELVVDRVKPLTPSLHLPENGKVTSDNTPSFGWENVPDNTSQAEQVSGVDHFVLQLDTSPAFSSPRTFDNLRENGFTLPAENSLPVGLWYWRVRAVDRAGNAGDWSGAFTLRIEDLVLTLFLSDNAVNPGESLTAHGRASWQPGNSPVVGENVEVSLDGSPLENLATDENGEYSLTLSSTVLGLHTVRVSLTDNQGTREENELTFKVETLTLTVSLNDYVVNPDQSLTVSGRVRRVWENVPETSATVSVYIDDQIAGEGGTNQSGDYSVAVKAPSSLGPHQLRVRAVNTEGITGENRTSFTVKTLSVSLSLTDTAGNPRSEANPGEALRISGTVRLQPEGFPVTLNPIDLFLDNVLIRTDNTDLWGSYRFDVTAPEEIGTYEYRVRITGPEGITGENFALLTVRRIDISMAYDDGVVNPGQVNRVSGRAVLQPGNQPVQFSKVSFSLFDENGSWSGGAENYTDANGNYSITFASPSRIGTYYGKASTTVGVFWSENVKELYVKTVRLSLTFDDNIVTLTQNFTMSGEAVLLPDNVPVRNTAVEIKVDGFPETTVYTDENGRYSYLYTKDAPAPSKHTVQVRLQNPEGIVGENTGYFEQRVVTFEWFGTLDSHGQFDGVLNPGENFYLAVRILENNGSEVFPVTMGSATVKVDGATPSPPGLTHVTSGYWRTYASYTAPSSLGTYVRYLDVSILTANGISGYVYGQPAPYQVKALRLPVLLSDRVVNPGENVTVSGTLTLLPEGTPVENENVILTFAGQEFVLPASSTGNYSLTLAAPGQIGKENVRVRVTDRRGLEAENSTTLTVGTLWISLIPQGEVAPEGVPFGFSGRALSLPDLTPASRINLQVYVSGQLVRSVQTLDNGDYSFTYTFPKRGLYEVRVSGVDAEGLRGENSREVLAGRPINLRGEVRSLEGTPIPTTFTFYEVGTGEKAFEVSTDASGRYSKQVFAGRFDLEVRFTGLGATLRYENLNLDQLQPYDNLENLVRADTPPSAFTSVDGTRATHRSVVVLLHPVFTDNFSRLTVTFDFSSYLSQVGDVWYLRVYRAEGWDFWTRVRSGTWINQGGTIDITHYTITAEDNLRSSTAAYVLAEYDPFATQVLRLENTISQMEQATGALTQASGTMSGAAENLKRVVDNMASIVSGLVTQENMKTLENTLLSPLQTMSRILDNLIALQGTSVGLMENMIDALWSGFRTVWQGIENLRQQESESASRLQSLMENAFQLMMENVAPREPITVDPESLSLELYQEGTADVYLTVKNNAFIPLDLRPSAAGEVKDEDFLAFSPTLLSLNPGETGRIKVSVKIPRRTPPKTYTGEVVIKDTATEKSVPVTIRVLPSARGLFDLKVTPMVRTVSPGGMLPVKVTLVNMGEMASETQLFLELLTSAGVTLLPDATGQSKLVEAGETVTVDASLQVPDTAEEGYYLVKARADYRLNGNVISVSATDTVEVRKYLRAELKMVPPSIAPGKVVRVGVEVKNVGNSSISSLVSVQLVTAAGEVIAEAAENLTLEAGETRLHTFELRVPENLPEGDYLVRTGGTYLWAGKEFSLTPDQEFMQVRRPPRELKVLGLPLWMLALLLLCLVGMGVAGRFSYRYVKRRRGAKRRFEATLFLNELPQPGPDSIKLGTLAEAKRDAYLKLNDLRMHVITAGATGGGKTISSMVIAEEALKQGKNVIVFDPTAQWTGFLRKCTDERMLSHYPRFGLTEADARSFPGVVKLITNPRQKIDMKELLGEEARGKITVFVIERLKPGDMDVFVTNVIQSIFESQPREHPELKVLLIFDEVHRLLPKYGGSGAGELQLERAVREFRKWGIGVMLVSQTIADFSETIKTNCRTQIQFWTREEEELRRIAAKYGEEHVRSVSRAPIGFGMVVNPDYNRGRPYYVNFRPILHSPFRLSPEELDKYYAADDRIENIKFKLKKLEEKGVDVFDLRIELGLAQRKLEEASFDMVNAYLDSLEPRVDEVCAKHKLKGIKRVIELVPEEEIRRTQMAAIRERERQLAMMKRPPEIVEAYKEILGAKKEVKHGEAEKPLKEEKEEEMVHPEARGEKLEEAEEKAKGEEKKKKNGGKNGGSKRKG
jgi:PGF-pre-PGF domain-containing protein